MKEYSKGIVVLFIDAPDPDNPACALALWNTFLKEHRPSIELEKPDHVHIVLTGRPVNLRTEKSFKDDMEISDQVPRQNWERTVEAHAQRLLEDSASRISIKFPKCFWTRFQLIHSL